MKKLFVTLILLLIVGGVVFYFGWIQFLIPDDGHAVVFSRTSGWEAEPIEGGEFAWRWERLLPTNMSLYIYRLEPQSIELSLRGTLPSGEIYRRVLEDRPDFSFRFDGSIRYMLNAEPLPRLSEEEGLRPDALDAWYDELAGRLQTSASDFLLSELGDPARAGADAYQSIDGDLKSHLASQFDEIRVSSVAVSRFEVPDVALYNEARRLYLSAIEADQAAVAATAGERASREARDQAIQSALRSYGEVLTEFPVLLEYFELGVDPLQLQELLPAQMQ